MKSINRLLLAAAISMTVAGPGMADTRSESALAASQFKKAAAARAAKPTARTTTPTQLHATHSGKANIHELVGKHARAVGVPVALALAIVRLESNFNPRARGQAGEIGLMQINPVTARGIGYKGSLEALYEPDTNLRWGMKYLAEAQRRGGGTLCGTILKYSAGHYATTMTPSASRYCGKVKSILRDPS